MCKYDVGGDDDDDNGSLHLNDYVCVLLSLCFTREIVVVQLLLLCRVFPSTHSTVSLALFTCTKRVLLTMMAS